jgi:hypothetical protein
VNAPTTNDATRNIICKIIPFEIFFNKIKPRIIPEIFIKQPISKNNNKTTNIPTTSGPLEAFMLRSEKITIIVVTTGTSNVRE